MKKLYLITALIPLLITNTTLGRSSIAQTPNFAQAKPEVTDQTQVITSKQFDTRAQILSAYLARFNSPLQYHAADFIEAADTYNLDWRLVAAISGVESTFGKAIPGGFNAWGWGVYGNQALGFSSWRDGIFTVSKGLRENYFNKGLTEPYSINRVYAASPFWGARVSYFLADMEKFTQNYQVTQINQAKLSLKPVPAYALKPAQKAQITTSLNLLTSNDPQSLGIVR